MMHSKLSRALAVLGASLSLSLQASAVPHWSELSLASEPSYSFADYLTDFNKEYPDEDEHARRRGIFEENLMAIRTHNSRTDPQATWKMGINQFADMSHDEFSEHMLGLDRTGLASEVRKLSEKQKKDEEEEEKIQAPPNPKVPLKMLPEDVDWRRRYTVTAVKDQGKCGSCWAFAAAETVESYWARASGELQDLSVQQILDCAHYTEEEDDNSTSTLPFHALSSNDDDADDDAPPMRRPTKDDPDDDDDDDHHKSDNSTDPTNTTETNVTKPERGGCQGGGAPIAAEVVDRMGGLETEWKYPYTSYMGKNYKCRYTTEEVQHVKQTNSTFRSAAQVHDWLALPLNNYAETLRHVALHGPLFVVVDASAWKFYATGVFNGCPVDNENVNLNHAVQLIGYGEDDTLGPYWLVRNSWAAKWGDGGFIRLRRVGGGAEFCGYDTFPLGVTPEGDEVFARQKVCGACGILIMPSFVRVGKPDWMPVNPEGPLPSSLSPRLRGGNVNVNAEKGEREPEREDILLE